MTWEIMELTHFVLDVNVILGRLSAKFQLRTMTVPQLVSNTISSLKNLLTRYDLAKINIK